MNCCLSVNNYNGSDGTKFWGYVDKFNVDKSYIWVTSSPQWDNSIQFNSLHINTEFATYRYPNGQLQSGNEWREKWKNK
jgi:hypothetical protein